MMILAKFAVGAATTLALATVYTFREGIVRVDVDEFEEGGAHVHVWAPASVVPLALHFVPDRKLAKLYDHAGEWAPIAHIAAQEMRRYPNSTFVEVQDGREHVRVGTAGAKVEVEVEGPEENVHVAVPLAMIDDVVTEIAERRPAS